MTPLQFRAALSALGWTQQRLANELEISVRSVNGYANGWKVPKVVELALDNLRLNNIAYLIAQEHTGRTIAVLPVDDGDFNLQLNSFASRYSGYAIGVKIPGEALDIIFSAEDNADQVPAPST